MSPYGTSTKRFCVIRSYEMHQRTERPEGQPRSAFYGTRCRVPTLTHLSGAMRREAAQSRAEIAGYEDRSWMDALRTVRLVINSWMIKMKLQERGVIYAVALPSGSPAVWLLVSTLRKFWPTWPSPYAHALRIVAPRPHKSEERQLA